MSYYPKFNDPNVEITSVVGSGGVDVTMHLGDFKSFIEQLMGIKDGGTRVFYTINDGKAVAVTMVVKIDGSKRLEES